MSILHNFRRTFGARNDMEALKRKLSLESSHPLQVSYALEHLPEPSDQRLILESMLARVSWLTGKQKDLITEAALSHRTALSPGEFDKLVRLLVAIPYAEQHQDAHGHLRTWVLSNIWDIGQHSLGAWQLNLKHAGKFGLSASQFKELMAQDSRESIELVIKVLFHIGLQKDPEHILAEYNAGENTTVIYPLQVTLNRLRSVAVALSKNDAAAAAKLRQAAREHLTQHGEEELLSQLEQSSHVVAADWPPVAEDGYWGPATAHALDACVRYLGLEREAANQEDAMKQAQPWIVPAIPPTRVVKNLGYVLQHLKRLNVSKLRAFFANDVDVRAYAANGLRAYRHLPTVI